MKQIVVKKRFGFNEPKEPHPDWYEPSDEPVEVSEACAECAIREGWAKPYKPRKPKPTDLDLAAEKAAKEKAEKEAAEKAAKAPAPGNG